MKEARMVSLTIDLPEEAFSALRVDPGQFAKELRFAAAVQWYHQGLISGSKAAEIAGMTRLAFSTSWPAAGWTPSKSTSTISRQSCALADQIVINTSPLIVLTRARRIDLLTLAGTPIHVGWHCWLDSGA
jgi:predicted HTH domain antitoxin